MDLAGIHMVEVEGMNMVEVEGMNMVEERLSKEGPKVEGMDMVEVVLVSVKHWIGDGAERHR
jgi:hypothetical protein